MFCSQGKYYSSYNIIIIETINTILEIRYIITINLYDRYLIIIYIKIYFNLSNYLF